MASATPYENLMAHGRKTHALSQASGILSWDQEVMMPPQGTEGRAEQLGALEAVIHQRRTDPKVGEWLAQLQDCNLNEVEAANVRLTKKSHERAVKIPVALAEELARLTSKAQVIWGEARQAKQFSQFAPTLNEILKLKRQEAACIAQAGELTYDALLNDFEPGMKVAVLQPLLESMRPRLTSLRQKILDSNVVVKTLENRFETKKQMALARTLGDVVGYDWSAGRLDLSTHPFSSGTGGDARITTRVEEAEPFGCLYSTLHELGHALYEQGVPKHHALTPVGQHVSMGVHESQSRIWENQIGRSLAFCQWFYPQFIEAFPDCGLTSVEDLHLAVNRVENGFIRTESDEVHYNLHVLLRFELERDLISGALDVGDLEIEWNSRFERDFGLAVPDASQGVLQDVHWSVGLFGYFPTYSLGNIYAGQLNEKLRGDMENIDDDIANGECGRILSWLRENIHVQGSLYQADQLIENVVEGSVSTEPLLGYLETKYGEIYQL